MTLRIDRKNGMVVMVFITMITSAFIGIAQDEPQSAQAELWSGFSAKTKINKRTKFYIEQQVRTILRTAEIRSAIFDLALKVEPYKFLEIKPQLRYDVNVWERNDFRYSLDIKLQHKFAQKRVELYSRSRFQLNRTNYTGELKTALREQIGTEFEIVDFLNLIAEFECFYRLDNKNEIRQLRSLLGVQFKLSDQTDLSVLFQVDKEVNVKEPLCQPIFNLKLSFEI